MNIKKHHLIGHGDLFQNNYMIFQKVNIKKHQTLVARLTRDIENYSFTGIDLIYEDNSKEKYILAWVGDSDYNNEGRLSYRYFSEYDNYEVMDLYVIRDDDERKKTIEYNAWKNNFS